MSNKSSEETRSLGETFQSFFETFPLYKKLSLELPEYVSQLGCDKIVYWCDICKTHTPFREWRFGGSGAGMPIPKVESDIYVRYLRCTGCNEFYFKCWYEVNLEGSWIRKIGQLPQWSIEIARDLERELKADAFLYKKALVLMSQSYGLGACVYLRRIIENHVSPLLRLIAEIRKSEGLDDKVAEIESALAGKDFSTKVSLAAELLPDSIKVDGVNPVRLLYEKLSVSIHGLSDDEAMDIALALRSTFEYVILELRRQVDSKTAFVNSIRHLAKP